MEEIFQSLKLRPGMPADAILLDMISDCTQDLRDMLHRDLEDGDTSILKELVLIKVNHDVADGIQSESHSGNTTTYLDDLPESLVRRIHAKRKLPRL